MIGSLIVLALVFVAFLAAMYWAVFVVLDEEWNDE
jgi:hypothetical protein